MKFRTFKVGLFDDIINTAMGVRWEVLKNRPKRLNASVKDEVQQFGKILWVVKYSK